MGRGKSSSLFHLASETNSKKRGGENVKIQFTQSVKTSLRNAERVQPAVIASVRFLENFYAGKFKDAERAELARKTINLYLKLRSAEAKLLREIAKKERR